MKKLMTTHKFGYIGYKGGAGPNEDQSLINTLAIQGFCESIGFNTKLVEQDEYIDVSVTYGQIPIVDVGYDRFGYCSSDNKLDQAGWDDTVSHLQMLFDAIVEEWANTPMIHADATTMAAIAKRQK